MDQDILKKLCAIGKLLREQDNRATDVPIFLVEEKRRFYGLDADYADADEVVWLDGPNDNSEATPEEHAELEAKYDNGDSIDDNWTRTAFKDEWHFVTACFTEQACKDYLHVNGHNLRETRIYAAGSYRNKEFRLIHQFLMSLED
jgi:hypothetical protein